MDSSPDIPFEPRPMWLFKCGEHDAAIAEALHDVEVARATSTPDAGDVANALNTLGCVLQMSRRYQEAAAAFSESLDKSEDIADAAERRVSLIMGLCNLGETYCILSKGQAAKRAFEEALTMIEAGPEVDPLLRGSVIGNLGWAMELNGDLEEAERLLLEGLTIARAAGRVGQEREHLDRLAVVLERRGDGEAARRLRMRIEVQRGEGR